MTTKRICSYRQSGGTEDWCSSLPQERKQPAFEVLVERHARRILRCAACDRQSEDAEDIVQQSFQKPSSTCANLREIFFSTWLTRVAINEAHVATERPGLRECRSTTQMRMRKPQPRRNP